MDEATKLAERLVRAVNKLQGGGTKYPDRHKDALEKLATIFKEATTNIRNDVPEEPPSSHNPTNPKEIRQAPRTHNRQTRNNTPGIIPTAIPTSEGVPSTSEGVQATPEGARKRKQEEIIIEEVNEDEEDEEEAPVRRSPHLNGIQTTTPTPRPRVMIINPRIITQEALNAVTMHTWLHTPPSQSHRHIPPPIEHFCAPVTHPTTGEIIDKYRKLAKDKELGDIWQTAFGKEFGGLAQGDNKTGQKGTNTLFVLTHEEIANIPKDRTVAYAKIVVDYRPQKEDPNRVRITYGGSNYNSDGVEVTTRTADLTTAKILWNSIVSTEGAKLMCIDISNFYLNAPLERYEYMKIPLHLFPAHTVAQYDLLRKAKGGFVYLEIRNTIYGLPCAGAVSNALLKKRLAPHGYYEVPHTPGLWKHISRPISFTLVVDDFGVKYVGEEHAKHLIKALEPHYKLSQDWTGGLYCGITLEWNYAGRLEDRYVDLSMPGYIKRLLTKYNHDKPKTPVHSPYPIAPRKYGKATQDPVPTDESPSAGPEGVKFVQQVVGSILYYGRGVDATNLTALSTLGSQQTQATEQTVKNTKHLLDYLATHPDARIRYHASDMILNVHSDASYLSETKA